MWVDGKWNWQYANLVKFKRNNGHCIVPKGNKQDKSLGTWVAGQRRLHSKNTIRQDRKDLLVKLGFVWNVQDHEWKLHYDKLEEFKRENGHCIVPHNYEQDKALGPWVAMQRNLHTKDAMPQDRKALFDEIGFVWKVDVDKKWRDKHEILVEFKRKNGHCLVPVRYEQDESLRRWVAIQRYMHTNNTLPQNRKDILNDLGFVWKVNKLAAHSSTTDNVRALVIGSFQRRFGLRSYLFSHSSSFHASFVCRNRVRNQANPWRKLNRKWARLENDWNVHLPSTVSDRGRALAKSDK